MELIKSRQDITIGDRQYSPQELRKVVSLLRSKQKACGTKLHKVGTRIALIEKFLKESRGKRITFGKWMKLKGLNCNEFFKSMGYYCGAGEVVSTDPENKMLTYHRNMKFNPEVGYHLPKRKVVSTADHNEVVQSKLGMTYDPALAMYFPTTVFDTRHYSNAEGIGDSSVDIMGGFTPKEIYNLNAFDEDSEDLTETIQELFEEEFDNVEGEFDDIQEALYELGFDDEDYSNAWGGVEMCKHHCGDKNMFGKRKSAKRRAKCEQKCERKEIRKDPVLKAENKAERKKVRKDNRKSRKQARKDKRHTKRELKKLYKAGKISKSEYKAGKKEARKLKQKQLKEAGGNFFSQVFQAIAKIEPTQATMRSALYILVGMNAFGFATRLAPALVDDKTAKEKFTPEAIAKAKKAWAKLQTPIRRMGGSSVRIKQNIIKGWMKRPAKISKKEKKRQRKSSASGVEGYEYIFEYTPNDAFVDEYSSVVGTETAVVAGYVITGLGLLGSLIGMLNKSGAEKDPFKKTPADYKTAMNDGIIDDAPKPNPNEPYLDPSSGEWLDPHSGRSIDPQTGEYLDEIFGLNKYLVIGGGVVLVGLVVMMLMPKKSN
jgi:hypothetical protein